MKKKTKVTVEITETEEVMNTEEEKDESDFLSECTKEFEDDLVENDNEIKSIKALNPERVARNKEIAQLAKSSNRDDVKKAIDMAVTDVIPYVVAMVNKFFYNNAGNFVIEKEDVCQEVYTQIAAAISNYNPAYSLLTFTQPKIKNAVQNAISKQTGFTPYYSNKFKILKEARAAFQEKGIMQPSIKDLDIATGLGMRTITNVLKQERASKEMRIDALEQDILDSDNEESLSSYHKSPESMFMHKEQGNMLKQALNELTDLERQIVMMRVVENSSWKDIADVTGEQIEIIKQTFKMGIKKLRHSEEIQSIRHGDKNSEARFNKREIAICPYDDGIELLNDLDLMDGIDSSSFKVEKPTFGIRE